MWSIQYDPFDMVPIESSWIGRLSIGQSNTQQTARLPAKLATSIEQINPNEINQFIDFCF